MPVRASPTPGRAQKELMVKEVSPQFNILGSTSVSATTTVTSSISGVLFRDSVCYHFNLSGAPTGIININCSGDYSPGKPQGPQGTGGLRAGNWATICSVAITAATTSPVIFDLTPISMPWIQAQFVSSTSSGVIDIWSTAKSYG